MRSLMSLSLLFDRYYDHSVKAVTRAERTKNIILKHLLSLKARLLEREIALGYQDNLHNKIPLIHLIAKHVLSKL